MATAAPECDEEVEIYCVSRVSEDGYATGHDIEVDVPCGPCSFEEQHNVDSVAYCLQCSEYLCFNCRLQHRKLRLTRSHNVVDIGNSTQGASNGSETEVCTEHHGKNIRYFCGDHQALCCKSCKNVDHKMCRGITAIEKLANGIKEGQELARGRSDLVEVMKRFEDLTKFKRTQNKKVNNQKITAVQKVKTLRASVNALFNYLEQEALREIEAESKTVTKELSNDEETYDSVVETLRFTNNNVDNVVRSACDAQVFITMKRASIQVQKYNDYLTEIEPNLKDVEMNFTEDETCQKLLNVVKYLGRVVINKNLTKSAMKCHRTSSLSFKRKKAVPIGGHAVRVPDDKTTCYITGSAFLDDGRLVLSDHNNKCMKMFNVDCMFTDQLVLQSRPNDIAVISQTEVATVLVDENILQFLSVDTKLVALRQIHTDVMYVGIACSKRSELFASCNFKSRNGEVHVLDINTGTINSVIGVSGLFVRPTSITMSNDSNRLYVSDIGQNSVICVEVSISAKNNTPIFSYTDRNLELRNGVTVDADDSLYVCSGNRRVHQISSTGVKIHEILTEKDGLGQPHSLSFSRKDNKLLVAEFKENSVKFYKLM